MSELVGRTTMWGRATHLGYRNGTTSLCGLAVLRAVVSGRHANCKRCLAVQRSVTHDRGES